MLKATLQRLNNPRNRRCGVDSDLGGRVSGGDGGVYPDSMTSATGASGVRDDFRQFSTTCTPTTVNISLTFPPLPSLHWVI